MKRCINASVYFTTPVYNYVITQEPQHSFMKFDTEDFY
jgi:hypothetical protein